MSAILNGLARGPIWKLGSGQINNKPIDVEKARQRCKRQSAGMPRLGAQRKSALRSLRLFRVFEFRIPIASSLRSEVQDIPDRAQQIDATLLDIARHSGMRAVAVAYGAVTRAEIGR